MPSWHTTSEQRCLQRRFNVAMKCVFCRFFICECYRSSTQPTHDVKTTLYVPHFNALTSYQRPYNVVLTSYPGWVVRLWGERKKVIISTVFLLLSFFLGISISKILTGGMVMLILGVETETILNVFFQTPYQNKE